MNKILIIGGTGALGQTLIRKYQNDNKIIVFSRDEHKQCNLKIQSWINKNNLSFCIGDMTYINSIQNAIENFRPNIVINTAALKVVPICEDNPYESVRVNILGHQNLIESVKKSNHKIEKLIFISTDKACKPINVYGMCKAISEKLYIEFGKIQEDIRVYTVRYGNVLDSTGSVIPLFKSILNTGETTLPITNKDMTRFLMSLTDATDLIQWTIDNDLHGKITIPKIKSMKIVDVANALFEWKKIKGKIKIVGIRPGEKLHEELISETEWLKTEETEKYYIISNEIIKSEVKSYNSFDSLIDQNAVYKFLEHNNILT